MAVQVVPPTSENQCEEKLTQLMSVYIVKLDCSLFHCRFLFSFAHATCV